jgi:hypothetical protein
MNAGDFGQVSCIVRRGDDPLLISWSFHGSSITPELGIITTPIGGRGSMLVIPSVGHKHRGNYTCKASNAAGVRTQTVGWNVNGEPNYSQEGTGKYSLGVHYLHLPHHQIRPTCYL